LHPIVAMTRGRNKPTREDERNFEFLERLLILISFPCHSYAKEGKGPHDTKIRD
jgi:hypothetical protein